MSLKRSIFLVPALLAMPLSAMADTPATSVSEEIHTPEIFVGTLVTEFTATVDPKTDKADERKLRQVLRDRLALKKIGRFLLRKDHRKAAQEAQLKRYEEAFPSYIASTYASRVGEMATADIRIGESKERRPGDYLIKSKIYDKHGAERADLVWRVQGKEGRYELVDVSLDGTWTMVLRRDEFNSVIDRDGFEALLSHMEEIAAKADSEDA